jgi:hypothetical protein
MMEVGRLPERSVYDRYEESTVWLFVVQTPEEQSWELSQMTADATPFA